MDTHTILAIDEDRETWDRLSNGLRRRGFNFHTAESAEEGYRKLEELEVDLILLDEALSGMDYLEIIREIKSRYTLPLFVLSREQDSPHKVVSIELGAEDHISKPIDITELAARIKSQLKLIAEVRAEALGEALDKPPRGLKFRRWVLDFDRYELRDLDDNPVELTSGELDILITLANSAGKVLSREQLFTETRGRDSDSFDRAVDVQISRIRQKLNHDEEDIIRTVRGVGYMLDVDVEKLT